MNKLDIFQWADAFDAALAAGDAGSVAGLCLQGAMTTLAFGFVLSLVLELMRIVTYRKVDPASWQWDLDPLPHVQPWGLLFDALRSLWHARRPEAPSFRMQMEDRVNRAVQTYQRFNIGPLALGPSTDVLLACFLFAAAWCAVLPHEPGGHLFIAVAAVIVGCVQFAMLAAVAAFQYLMLLIVGVFGLLGRLLDAAHMDH